jgi:hypothetical protein
MASQSTISASEGTPSAELVPPRPFGGEGGLTEMLKYESWLLVHQHWRGSHWIERSVNDEENADGRS